MKENLHIGARSLKTALAVFLCLVIDLFITRTNGVYSCISAIICMMPTTDETWEAGVNRVVSTLLAGVAGAGILSLYTLMPTFYRYARLVLIPLFIILLILVCNITRRTGSVALSCAIFIILSLGPYMHISEVLSYTGWRMFETLIGIFVAMGVNHFVRPPPKSKK